MISDALCAHSSIDVPFTRAGPDKTFSLRTMMAFGQQKIAKPARGLSEHNVYRHFQHAPLAPEGNLPMPVSIASLHDYLHLHRELIRQQVGGRVKKLKDKL
ncbi:hypothetical protein DV096_14805 [Bradymonadaceae bacterium TMQ3]|nr:hypothetical protein DV096_14805 [Bradymonadaceae bacterium TMQ3]